MSFTRISKGACIAREATAESAFETNSPIRACHIAACSRACPGVSPLERKRIKLPTIVVPSDSSFRDERAQDTSRFPQLRYLCCLQVFPGFTAQMKCFTPVMIMSSHLPSRKGSILAPPFYCPRLSKRFALSPVALSISLFRSLSLCPVAQLWRAQTQRCAPQVSSLTAPRTWNALNVSPSACFTRGGENRFFQRTRVCSISTVMEQSIDL